MLCWGREERVPGLGSSLLLYFRENIFTLLIRVIQVQGENTGKQKNQRENKNPP